MRWLTARQLTAALTDVFALEGRRDCGGGEGCRERQQREGQETEKEELTLLSSSLFFFLKKKKAEMLERMIIRYANRKSFTVSELDRSPGDEAGIKHVSFEVR